MMVNYLFLFIFDTNIVNCIENEGAKSLGELLTLMNKTLTRLDLSRKGKRTRI